MSTLTVKPVSSLNPRKRFHRLVAWVLLIAFVGPTLLGLLANQL